MHTFQFSAASMFPQLNISNTKTDETLLLQGGLGNQVSNLICLFATLLNDPRNVNLDFAHIMHHRGDWRNTFLGLSFFHGKSNLNLRSRGYFFFRGLSCSRQNLDYLDHSGHTQGMNLSSKDSGFVGLMPRSRNRITYLGDFQSYRYLEILEDFFTARESIQPKSPSKDFRYLKSITSWKNTLGVHVRRGDYLNDPKSWGTLNLDYYAESFSKLPTNQIKNVFIFSDSKSLDKKLVANIFPRVNIHYIDESFKFSSCETLFLFRECQYKIIANSSFSWLGGILGYSSYVVYPVNWFIKPTLFNSHFPTHWIPVNNTLN